MEAMQPGTGPGTGPGTELGTEPGTDLGAGPGPGRVEPEPERPARSRVAPTPLMAALLLLAGLPSAVEGWAWLSGALTVILAVSAAVDFHLSRRRVELVRRVGPVLSLGAENLIGLELRTVQPPLQVTLRDDLPNHIELAGTWPRILLNDTQWAGAQYRLIPHRRGAYAIGPLHARFTSRLGLWQRQLVWRQTVPVRVYPNLLAARQLEIAIRRGRQLEGLRRARLRGMGTEFESLREYQPGDQYRSINWPATARSGELITTLYQIDRSQPVMLLIDAGRTMTPHVRGLARLDHALNAALLLATAAAERGDQLGLMLFGGEVKAFMVPRKGRGQVLAMLEALYAVEPEQVEPDYGRMISWFRAKHKKRSLVVLFTDLIDPDISRGLISHLAALAAHHLVLLVCLSDPELLQVSKQMPARSGEVYQKATALDVLAQRAETKARLQAMGVMVVDVPPEEFSTAVLNQYLLIREQGRL